MASVFTVTEEDLFNFASFCDSKYMDANCQKYGFFKIKLDAGCAGQCSSMSDFRKQFKFQYNSKIRKAILLKNPNSCHLFGLQHVLPTSAEKTDFMNSNQQLFDMNSSDDSLNCCMKALEQGEDAFLQHFFIEVTSNPKLLERNNHDDLLSIRRRAVAKKIDFQKRQSYKTVTSMEGKKRCLELAMLSEKILESSSSECRCDSCNTKYSFSKTTKSTPDKQENNGLLYSAGIEETQNNYLHVTKNFAMAHLCYTNMLADLDSVFGGVSFPALYLGGLHSIFPIHTEDLSFWSFNFLFHGLPKFWIIIPPTCVNRLTDALQRRGFYGFHRWCRNTLNHKFYIPTPQFLKEENIPFELVIQREGEGVVLLPNSAHTGGNLGANLAQACNFGSKSWIPYGCVSLNCPCMENAVHADLSDLVAVHQPSLLKSYLDNNIVNVIEDDHFQKSIVVPKKDSGCGSVSTPPIVHDDISSKRRNLSQAKKPRVKCPICDVSWAYVQKQNMINHINKHHKRRIADDEVIKFMEEYALSIQ